METKTISSSAVVALAAFLFALPAELPAGSIFFDDFNSENGGVPTINYTGFANWDVTRGRVDLIGPGLFDAYPGNGLYVDLDGSTVGGDQAIAGRLESKTVFPLAAPVYVLEFDLGGTTQTEDNIVTVSLGSVFSETFTLPNIPGLGTTPFTHITRTISIASPTSGRLVFDHAGGDNYGLILDNVRLSAVPEPGSAILVGSCLLLLGLWKLRSRRRLALQRADASRKSG